MDFIEEIILNLVAGMLCLEDQIYVAMRTSFLSNRPALAARLCIPGLCFSAALNAPFPYFP